MLLVCIKAILYIRKDRLPVFLNKCQILSKTGRQEQVNKVYFWAPERGGISSL